MSIRMPLALSFCLLAVFGCDGQQAAAPPAQNAVPRTEGELHAALHAKNPHYTGSAQMRVNGESITALDLRDTGVTDLSPLKGLPLEVLYAENTSITDLKPLAGMRLVELSLSDTPVADLEPLRGMPIATLRLVNTQVRDLAPLAGMPLEMLWVTHAPVTSAAALAGSPLISLTLEGTEIDDVEFVRQLPNLQRLHIAGTNVTDLTPLAGLPLTRLIFTPSRITQGIDAARHLPQCGEFGLRYDGPQDVMRPDQFWAAYDAGAFK